MIDIHCICLGHILFGILYISIYQLNIYFCYIDIQEITQDNKSCMHNNFHTKYHVSYNHKYSHRKVQYGYKEYSST